MRFPRASAWLIGRESPMTVAHSVRTALAAVLSYGAAQLLPFPQTYWAPISALVVMQSTLEASLLLSAQRIAGTALGVTVGALVALYSPSRIAGFGVGILVMGLVFAAFHIERSVFRYAGIALAIVQLVPRADSAWSVAGHRFLEVTLGIAVALVVTAAWPERKPGAPTAALGSV